jgi:hypothetical protein
MRYINLWRLEMNEPLEHENPEIPHVETFQCDSCGGTFTYEPVECIECGESELCVDCVDEHCETDDEDDEDEDEEKED